MNHAQHVPSDLLASFVEGDLDDQLAAHIADHLDDCPMCASRAALADPLAAAFAAVSDPAPPADLVATILARFEAEPSRPATAPESAPLLELAVGVALIGAALAVAFATGTVETPLPPGDLMAHLNVVSEGLASAGRAIAHAAGATMPGLVLTAVMALCGCLVTARLALGDSLDLTRRIS